MLKRGHVFKLFAIGSVLTVITNFPSGFTNSSVNTAVSQLTAFIRDSYARRGYNITPATQDLVHSAILNSWFVAQVAGSLLAPFVTDKFGRKCGYLLSTIMMTLGSIIQLASIFVWSPELLFFGRFALGLFSPLCDVALVLYLQESSPTKIRGALCFLGELGYCMMCLVGMLAGMRSVLGDSLQKLFASSILPGVLSVVFLLFVPETPKYLMITRRDRAKALESLRWFQGDKKENEAILDEYMNEIETSTKRSSVREVITTPHLRFAVLLSCCVLILTISFYPILQSSTRFFESIGIQSDFAQLSSTGVMVVFTLACIGGSLFIDRYPRRHLVLGSGALATLFISLFVVCSALTHLDWRIKYVAVAVIYAYAVVFGTVLGPISWFVAPELVTQRHRSTLFCVCYGLNNIFIACVNFAVNATYAMLGAYVMLPLLVVPSIVCLIVIYKYLPETRNKETSEIVESIKRKQQPKLQAAAAIAQSMTPSSSTASTTKSEMMMI